MERREARGVFEQVQTARFTIQVSKSIQVNTHESKKKKKTLHFNYSKISFIKQ